MASAQGTDAALHVVAPHGYAAVKTTVTYLSAASDQLRVYSVLIHGTINNRELLILLDTGCEVDVVSETEARKGSLPVQSLAQTVRLRLTQ